MIDAIAVPGLNNLFNLPSLVEEAITNLVKKGVSNIVDAFSDEIHTKIDHYDLHRENGDY
jgi:hypothetical protein